MVWFFKKVIESFDFLYNYCLQHFSLYIELSDIWSKMYVGLHVKYEGGPKKTSFFLNRIFLWTFPNLITLKIPLENQYTYPTAFSIVQNSSGSLECLRRFFPHLLHILKTLSFKVPLHSWKQEKIAGCQVRGVGGVRSRCHPVFREKLPHTQCCVGGSIVVMQKPLTWPPQFGAFSSHSITHSLEHFKVKLLVNSLTLW